MNSNPLEHLYNEIDTYKHITEGKVKFHEVDSAAVAHNVQYLFWLEWARTNYFIDLGVEFDNRTFVSNFPMMVVHTTIDYFNAAKFMDNYQILTKISQVKTSSLKFENIVRLSNGKILVKASNIMVHLNPKTKTPERIPDEIREKIRILEGDNCKM